MKKLVAALSIAVFVVLVIPLVLIVGFVTVNNDPPVKLEQTEVKAVIQPIDITATGLWEATNKERVALSLGALALDESLNASASAKCADMVEKNYWAHNAPDGTEPWHFIEKYVNSYSKAGENLAHEFNTSPDVVTGWMNSPTHRDNMLDPVFTDVGFGICDFRGTKLVVQHLKS